MSNQNQLALAMPANLTEAINMGKMFFESGLFTDLKSAAQAVVKIQAGAEIGIPPFAALTGIHIIQGKPTLGAGLIASRVKSSGKYDYKVKEQSDNKCSIDFYQGKEMIGNSTFTIEDARKAGTKNIDKFAKNMLFARAISNGVKWYCPDVFQGPVYISEEFDEAPAPTVDVQHEVVKGNGGNGAPPVTMNANPAGNSNGNNSQPQQPLTEFQKQYNTPEVVDEVLGRATTVKDIANLYFVNAELIEAHPGLKDMFSAKKMALQSAMPPVTADNESF